MSGENLTKGSDWIGAYSRFSYDDTKNYVMLLKEQGVPLLDDELNFMQEAQLAQLRRVVSTFLGDGSPDNGFLIVGTGATNNFTVKAGKISTDGWVTVLGADSSYTGQPAAQQGLTTPGVNRADKVYLDIWHEEIDGTEDTAIVDPTLAIRTSCRLAIKWAVKVTEGGSVPPNGLDGQNKYHWYYYLADINRIGGDATITAGMVVDKRRIISFADIYDRLAKHRHDGGTGIYSAPLDYATTGGSANTYTLDLTNNLTAHVPGLPIRLKCHAANTGASTIAIDALSAVAIKRPDGSDLQAGDIKADQIVEIVHDGTYYQMTSAPGTRDTVPEATLSAASNNVAWNWSTGQNSKLSLTASGWTVTAPSNLVAGKYASLRIAQDATGSRSLSFAANYKGMSGFNLSTDPNSVDWLLFRAVDGTNCELVGVRNAVGA